MKRIQHTLRGSAGTKWQSQVRTRHVALGIAAARRADRTVLEGLRLVSCELSNIREGRRFDEDNVL